MTKAGGSTVRRLIGSAFGLGRLPVAPGTWASLATALALLLLLPPGAGAWSGGGGPLIAGALVALCALGIAVGNRAALDWDGEDPGAFVLDEVVGQGLALLPLLPAPLSVPHVAAGFVLFRIFDVVKPPPCRALERLPGGLGIMADDLMAGAYAAGGVALLAAVWPPSA